MRERVYLVVADERDEEGGCDRWIEAAFSTSAGALAEAARLKEVWESTVRQLSAALRYRGQMIWYSTEWHPVDTRSIDQATE